MQALLHRCRFAVYAASVDLCIRRTFTLALSSREVGASAVPPFLLKTPDNPEGVDDSVFEGTQKAIVADRYAFFTEFFKNFYNADLLLGKRVSEQAVQSNWNVASLVAVRTIPN